MRYIFTALFLYVLLIGSCTQKSKKTALNKKTDLKQKLSQIDTLVVQDRLASEDLIVTANGDRRLIDNEDEIPNTKLDTTFTLWRNEQGTIKRADVYPYSKSGDWTAAFLHYFDDQGRTFAFRQSITFFGNYCEGVSRSGSVTTEDIRWYYDSTFSQTDSTYAMKGTRGESVAPDSCENPYQYFELVPSRNLSDYLKRIQYESAKNRSLK